MSLRRSLLFLRYVTLFQCLLLFAQVTLAGGFLGGHFDMLQMHGAVGGFIMLAGIVMVVAAFLVRRAGGPSSSLGASVVLLIAILGQSMLGFYHSVALHVLLGCLIVAALALLTQRVMTTPLPPASSGTPDQASELVA